MKQIIAYIRPAVLERVTEALRLIDGLTGMSVMEVKGFGQGKGVFLSETRVVRKSPILARRPVLN